MNTSLLQYNICQHVPRLFREEFAADDQEALWLHWHGFDVESACKNATLRCTFDVMSLFVQLFWTILCCGELLNVVSTDMHPHNILIEEAPFGGQYEFTFITTHTNSKGTISRHILKLTTHFKVTIVDWALVDRACPLLKVDERIANVLYTIRHTESRSTDPDASTSSSSSMLRRKSGSMPASVSSFSAASSMIRMWNAICKYIRCTPISSSIHMPRGRDIQIEKLPLFFPHAGARGWFELCSLMDGFCSDDNSENISVESNISHTILDDIGLSLRSFAVREFVQWRKPLHPISIPFLSPRILAHSSPPDTPMKKKRGPKPKYGDRALTSTERSRIYRRRGKSRPAPSSYDDNEQLAISATKKRNTFQESDEHNIAFVAVPGLFDSSFVTVAPSTIAEAELGVFAISHIPKDSVITSYYGKLQKIAELNKFGPIGLEHVVADGKGNALAGARLPIFGLGVASLVNSAININLTANARLDIISDVYNGLVKCHVTATVDIHAGEEIFINFDLQKKKKTQKIVR